MLLNLINNTFKNISLSLLNICHGDAPERWQMTVQDPATNTMEGIINFHNFILCIIIAIAVSVGIVLIEALWKFNAKKHPVPTKFAHASILEIVWTAIPALILLYIAGPSFTLLYALDENCSRSLVYKVTGSQWFWTYSFPDMVHYSEHVAIESNLEGYKRVRWAGFRLLEVDQRIFVPQNVHITFLITSTDVLHSWAIPSFGIKLDACPGRLAHITMYFPREGTFYGQCSEICGAGHGFMPIVVRVVNLEKWGVWANYEKE